MVKQACKKCKRIVLGDKCSICNETKLSKDWKGRIFIISPDKSELAKSTGHTLAGEYALRI